MKRPTKPARDTIAPSDLTFGLSTCKRCIWIKYWFKVTLPGQFPIVGTLSKLQENFFQGVDMPSLHPSLRAGTATKWGQWVKSDFIKINGVKTPWRILGIYDLLAENQDGTLGLIDCKVSDSDRDNGSFYAPQLESYAYALENPAIGKAQEVASMGLLVWKPISVINKDEIDFGFGVKQSYVPVEREPDTFTKVIEELLTVIDGEYPDAGANCGTCNYLTQRLALE
jgi:hypothetical protein